MPAHTLVSKIKSGIALLLLFPLITFALLAVLQPVPALGSLAYAATFFAAPGIWILAAIGNISTARPSQMMAALWLHYPVLGFLAGFFFPFEVALKRRCAKQIAVRYGLSILIVMGAGIALALYAAAHDS